MSAASTSSSTLSKSQSLNSGSTNSAGRAGGKTGGTTYDSDVQTRSDALKAQGNVHFGKKEYQAALAAYSAAISLTPDSFQLFSNRSATNLHLNHLNIALQDADKAIQLAPQWSKAHRRRGNVLEVFDRLEEARDSYTDARRFETDNAAKADLTRAIEAVERKIEDRVFEQERRTEKEVKKHVVDEAPAKIITRQAEARILEGETSGSWPPIASCARRLMVADSHFTVALQLLSTFQKHDLPASANAPPGAFGVSGQLQTLAELTTAAMEDVRVVYFGESDLEKIRLCYMLEQQQRNAIGPGLNVVETIAKYKERIDAGYGWDVVRPALQLSIRTAFLNGMLKEGILSVSDTVPDRESSPVEEFRRAVGLVEEGRRVFSDVPNEVRGRTLEATFLRGLKVRLGEALIKAFHQTNPPSLAIIREIKSIGDWLVASCESDSAPGLVPDDPEDIEQYWTLYQPHWGYPRGMGHIFRGMAYLQLGLKWEKRALDSKKTGKRGPSAGGMKELKLAAEEYAIGASWLPDDDPEMTSALWYSIFAMIRRGGYYLGDLIAMRAICLSSSSQWIPFFGSNFIPSSHPGKLASSEALRQSEGAEPETICSPLVEWELGVDVDTDILNEVMMPYITGMLRASEEDGGGMVLIAQKVLGVWATRSAMKEPGAGGIWERLGHKVVSDWEHVEDVYKTEKAKQLETNQRYSKTAQSAMEGLSLQGK